MSYPRKLHVLILEDEQDPIETYCELLETFRLEFPSVEPVVARSYDDAKAWLQSPQVFHVVILDLNLPLATRQQPPTGIAPGQELLEMLAQREDYPIPVVLVVSGWLNIARLSELRDRLARDFWYGEMVNKGHTVADELKKGLQKALEYSDVGIHVRDAGRTWFPTLSPREQDLLRRCVLAQTSCLGIDLEWWGAENGPSVSRPSPNAGPTKVLMGRFLLDDGLGVSRPTFFKFEPVGNAPYVCRDAAILNHKLSHVKVQCSAASRTRSILVTQSVTDGVPVALDDYLLGDTAVVKNAIPGIVADVIDQLNQLGRTTEGQVPVRQLLWPHHDRVKIASAWDHADIRQVVKAGEVTPLQVFDRVRCNAELTWVCRRSCTHGDLNATNIAVEAPPGGRPRAFIFDAAGVHADVDLRDLAALEVTTLLFCDDLQAAGRFHVFRKFYEDALTPTVPDRPDLTDGVRNVMALISAIRAQVENSPHPNSYALMVFDAALLQLGGLAVQPSWNRIADRLHACYIASWTASWLASVVPEYLGTVPTATSEVKTLD